jgi:hypothetical protein
MLHRFNIMNFVSYSCVMLAVHADYQEVTLRRSVPDVSNDKCLGFQGASSQATFCLARINTFLRKAEHR